MATATGHGSTSELELRDYLRVLKRRKRIVLLTMGVVLGAALLASYVQEPVYAAHSRLLIQPNQSESPFDPDTGVRVDARALATNIEILKSELVRSEVRSRLGSAPRVAAAPVGDTDVVEVTAESSDPERAAEVADAYANAYIEVRRRQTVDGLLAAGEQIQDRISTLQQEITALDAQLAAVPDPEQAALARDSVNEQRVTLVQQQALFSETLDKLTVAARLASGGAQLVGSAEVPTTPVKPQPIRNGVLAVAIGLMLGVGLAFLAEYLDDSVKTREDLERISGLVPVIGVIPSVGAWKERDDTQLVSLTDPNSSAAEAYRTVRTAIHFVALDRPMGIIQVTSSNAGEGKTTTMANLGVALAKAGQSVILVCCDLRRPRLHEFFGLSNEVGFTSMLLGEAPISRALQPVPGIPRLRLLASGPLPPNPSELLSSGRTKEVFAALKADADIVLIDSPPVLPVTDALVLFRHVDATLMVFAAGSTTQKQASTALAMAQQVNAPLVGTVLNGGPSSGDYGSRYAYNYRVTPEEPDAGVRGRGKDGAKADPASGNGVKESRRKAAEGSSARPVPEKMPRNGS